VRGALDWQYEFQPALVSGTMTSGWADMQIESPLVVEA
jgi:hypothetical protein